MMFNKFSIRATEDDTGSISGVLWKKGNSVYRLPYSSIHLKAGQDALIWSGLSVDADSLSIISNLCYSHIFLVNNEIIGYSVENPGQSDVRYEFPLPVDKKNWMPLVIGGSAAAIIVLAVIARKR